MCLSVCNLSYPEWKAPVSYYKVVQIWPGLFVCKQVTVCSGHIWTTLYIVICGLFDSTKFFHIIIQNAQFSKKKVNVYQFFFLIFSAILSKIFSIVRRVHGNIITTVRTYLYNALFIFVGI
jgi:hypothetical protein